MPFISERLFENFEKMNSAMSNSQLSQKMREIFDWGYGQCGFTLEIGVPEFKSESLRWVFKLFPEDCDEEDRYLREGDQEEIKVKYVMMHCLLELWFPFYHPEVDHRKNVFEKVMRGKERGWIECQNANDDLNPNGNPIRNEDYYMKYRRMFDYYGIKYKTKKKKRDCGAEFFFSLYTETIRNVKIEINT